MTFVAVLPSIVEEWTAACVGTMSPRLWANCLLVDNTRSNLGVSASWNRGVAAMREQNAEWLVIVSAAVRFGAPGGDDFLDALDQADGGEWAIEGGECPRQRGIGFGWHLIAFRSSTFDRVGTFDENFYPAYWEDCDFGHRIRCASPSWSPGPDPLWPKVDVDADLVGFAHGVKVGRVVVDSDRLIRYYSRKWGGLSSQEEYDRPFGDPKNGLDYWPVPDPR